MNNWTISVSQTDLLRVIQFLPIQFCNLKYKKSIFVYLIIKKELNEAERLKFEAKNLLSNYENKIDKSQKETREIINLAKKDSEKNILEKTKKFHQLIENKNKYAEQKIIQMKENALRDIKNISVKVSMEAVEHLIKNSIDKNKIAKLYIKSLEQAKTSLKHLKA